MRFTSIVFFLCLFSSFPAFAKNTKVFWNKAAKTVGVNGHTETWNYQTDRLNKNGTSEAFLFIPDHASPDNIAVVVWFHGCGGYSDRTFDVRLAKQLKILDDRNLSYALVVPELHWSKNTSTTCGRQGRSFKKAGQLISFVNDSISRINSNFVNLGMKKAVNPRVIFVGHSAGGSVIKAASISGDLCKINPTDVVWSDSTYGRWFDSAWSHCLSRGNFKVTVLIRKWTTTWKNFRRFTKGKLRRDFLKTKFYTGKVYHKTIGDNALEFSEVFPPGC